MDDAIVRAGGSLLQHGAYNDRIYLMKLAEDDYPGILDDLEKLARNREYGKIVAKIPDWARAGFLQMGYQQEAAVPGLFNGVNDGYFFSKFLSDRRAREKDPEVAASVIHTASMRCREREDEVKMPEGPFHCRICKDADVTQMAKVYQEVFETYPFPVHNPEYIAKTMLHNFVYLGIWHSEKLIALCAIETDLQSANGEMTDFATLPAYRGKGLSHFLLYQAERVVAEKEIRTVYTIARATSFGMNITFAKRGYVYTGRLVNNTNISGSFESMNVWYKPL